MANTRHASMRHSGQRNLPAWLCASLIGALLTIALPAAAETDAERIKDLERKLEALQNEVSQLSSGMSHHSAGNGGVPLHGFMDAGYAINNQSGAADNPKGFYVGSLSFYLAPSFGDNVKTLVEPNFEVNAEGAVTADIERLQIGYAFSDAATVWGGRFHTPYGYWNTAFHHGAQIQTAILRPRFLDFEDDGGILPSHMVGILATGKFRTARGRLTYDAFVGNGPRIIGVSATTLGTLDPSLAGDSHHSVMAGLNLGYELSGNLSGLRLAAHGISGDVDTDTPLIHKETALNIFGGSAVYLANDWEVMSEYYRFANKDISGATGTHGSWASYLQAGRNYHHLTPYARLEKAVLNQQDNYFASQANGQSYTRQALGLRYDVDENMALKLELLNSTFMAEALRTAAAYRSLFVQYAIGF